MNINVVLIDDNPVTLRHFRRHLEPMAELHVNNEIITCAFHPIQPLFCQDNSEKVDLAATLKEVVRLKPGVAVIDMRLEGDAIDDYSGADLSLKIKEVCNDCCIILVSHYFHEAPRLLDNLEVFRHRVDLMQADYGDEIVKRFTEAVRCHVSAVEFRRLLGTSVAHSTSRAVYLSYAWDAQGSTGLSLEDIVDQIEDSLRRNSYDVKRDRTNLGYGKLISSFMDEIGRGGCIVAVISEKYIFSRFCMDELLKIHRNHDFHQRICPVVLPGAKINDFKHRLECIDHWTKLEGDIEKLFKKIRPGSLSTEELRELHVYRDIAQESGRLLSFIANMNQLTPDTLAKDDFAILRTRINDCLS